MAAALLLSCTQAGDPRTLEGALGKAALALGQRDSAALFRVIDQRARFAMASIVHDRRQASDTIRTSYPESAQRLALRALGDAATVENAADLFRLRCSEACLSGLAQQVGAPVEVHAEGGLQRVKTTRGGELALWRGKDGWYGIVWHTDELSRERTRAAAELELVQNNAALYRKQQALE